MLSWASLTCAKLGLKAPTNPEVCHVVPPPNLNSIIYEHKFSYTHKI